MFREFLTPSTIEEAVKLRNSIDSSMYLAGGTEINSIVWPCRSKISANTAIYLDKLPLKNVKVEKTKIEIGASVTIQELVENKSLPPMLLAAVRLFANRNVRTMGTIGGNIGGNRACSNIAPMLLALNTSIMLAGKNSKEKITLEQYFSNHDSEKLILSIEIPSGWQKRRWAVRKHTRTANDVSLVSAAVSFSGTEAKIEEPIIAVNGVVPHATRLYELEKKLDGQSLPSREAIDEEVKKLVNPESDLRGSSEFKKHLSAVLVSDALHEAAHREVCR